MKHIYGLKNVFTYNYELSILDPDGQTIYRAICERAVEKERTMLIWLDDFELPAGDTETVKAELEEWLQAQGIKCQFCPNHRIS